MADVEKVILIPRYTSFVGIGTFYMAPVNVRDFCQAEVSFWRGGHIGTLGTPSVVLEESPDLATWRDLATFRTSEGTEEVQSVALAVDWLRVVVKVTTGAVPAFTCWSTGNFERRQGPVGPA
jgi:hypothetical protein